MKKEYVVVRIDAAPDASPYVILSSSKNDFICCGFEMFILASVSGLLISNAVLIRAILALVIFFGIPE